jgi:hypothetical protein
MHGYLLKWLVKVVLKSESNSGNLSPAKSSKLMIQESTDFTGR